MKGFFSDGPFSEVRLIDIRDKILHSEWLHSAKVRALISAVWSALTWGSWAFIANLVSLNAALLAGFSQASISFVTTLIGSVLLEILFTTLGSTTLAISLSVIIVSSISLISMLWIHINNATPNLLLTILPIYTVVVCYCYFYLLGLKKLKALEQEKPLV